MIQINDDDLPITVAGKIINGVKPYNPTDFMKNLAKVVVGDEHANDTQDMFDIEEIKEIADHLMVYYQAKKIMEEKMGIGLMIIKKKMMIMMTKLIINILSIFTNVQSVASMPIILSTEAKICGTSRNQISVLSVG